MCAAHKNVLIRIYFMVLLFSSARTLKPSRMPVPMAMPVPVSQPIFCASSDKETSKKSKYHLKLSENNNIQVKPYIMFYVHGREKTNRSKSYVDDEEVLRKQFVE